jgi:hypothetical protein
MAVVRGDRIGESRTLNKASREAHLFYSGFVAAAPDDFGRFRISSQSIWAAMFPRREPKPADLRWVLKMVAELTKIDAFLVYEVDGQQFGEVAKWKPTGNMVHRCPEPPQKSIFMPHEHSLRCLSTAIARAKEWGTREEVSILINRLNSLKGRKPDGAGDGSPTEQGTERGAEGGAREGDTRQLVNSSTRIRIVSESGAPVDPHTFDAIRAARAECKSELQQYCAATERPADQALASHSRPHGGKSVITNIDNCDSLPWLRVTAERLRGSRLAHEAEAADSKQRSPPRSVDAKNTDAIQRAIERRRDAGQGEGSQVLDGVVTDRKSLPPGS